MNQEILRINKKFTDDIYELNKKYDYWINNKNFERIAPLDPTRLPAMMSIGLLSEKPIPAAAQPE